MIKKMSKYVVFVIIITLAISCRSKNTQSVVQIEQRLIDSSSDILTDSFLQIFQNSLEEYRDRSDYQEILRETEEALDELRIAILEEYSIASFRQSLNELEQNLQVFNGTKTSLNSGNIGSCIARGLGMGYKTSAEINVSTGAEIVKAIGASLGASGGGGVSVIYDFVNLDRQFYTHSYCSFGGGLGVGLSGCFGETGFKYKNSFLFGLRPVPGNTQNRFAGASGGIGVGVEGKLKAAVGVSLGAEIGTSFKLAANCSGLQNLSICPSNFEGSIDSFDPTFSITFYSGASVGPCAGLSAVLSANAISTCTSAVNDSYTHFSNHRIVAGTRMASELLKKEIISGFVVGISGSGLVASGLALIHGFTNPASCGSISPTVGTMTDVNVAGHHAILEGLIISDGGENIIERGIVWGKEPNPSIGTDNYALYHGNSIYFDVEITGLDPSTTYYARAFARNNSGTGYGDSIEFVSGTESGTVTDIDGNVYETVQIGNQVWMAQNLRVTRYRNGSQIPTNLSDIQWSNTNSGAYSVYPHQGVNGINSRQEMLQKYGALYNGFAVTDSRGLCPTGWKVPSDNDWIQLEIFLNNQSNPGNKLKDCRQQNSQLGGNCNTNVHPRWDTNNTHFGTNDFGFSALPDGFRGISGAYLGIGSSVYYWSSTLTTEGGLWGRNILNSRGSIESITSSKRFGDSVRCIQQGSSNQQLYNHSDYKRNIGIRKE